MKTLPACLAACLALVPVLLRAAPAGPKPAARHVLLSMQLARVTPEHTVVAHPRVLAALDSAAIVQVRGDAGPDLYVEVVPHRVTDELLTLHVRDRPDVRPTLLVIRPDQAATALFPGPSWSELQVTASPRDAAAGLAVAPDRIPVRP